MDASHGAVSGHPWPVAARYWKSSGHVEETSRCSFSSSTSIAFWLIPQERPTLAMIVAALSFAAPAYPLQYLSAGRSSVFCR